MTIRTWLLLSLLKSVTTGQAPPPGLHAVLPVGAKVIETADVSDIAGKPRSLVLWMLQPKRVNTGEEFCGTAVYGHWVWEGPARLSLPSLLTAKEPYYAVPSPQADGKGIPKVLNLKDLTGDGLPAELVLYQYEACGIVSTSVLGYQKGTDKVRHYPIETHDPNGGRNTRDTG
jgi:hypothetical protein